MIVRLIVRIWLPTQSRHALQSVFASSRDRQITLEADELVISHGSQSEDCPPFALSTFHADSLRTAAGRWLYCCSVLVARPSSPSGNELMNVTGQLTRSRTEGTWQCVSWSRRMNNSLLDSLIDTVWFNCTGCQLCSQGKRLLAHTRTLGCFVTTHLKQTVLGLPQP